MAYLRCLPAGIPSLKRIDWAPVDILSEIIIEPSGPVSDDSELNSSPTPANSELITFFHVVNLVPTTWDTLTPTTLSSLPKNTIIVSWGECISRLQELVERNEAKQNSGIKLLEFYGCLDEEWGMPVLSVDNVKVRSATMRGLGAVNEE